MGSARKAHQGAPFGSGSRPSGHAPADREPPADDPSRGLSDKPAQKAYAVSNPDGDQTEIVFATQNIVARRVGANRLDCYEIGGISCRRIAWADQYAVDQCVPASACVRRGWWFEECAGCGRRIDTDELAERRLTYRDVVGFANAGLIYCCKTCKTRDEREKRRCERVGSVFMGKLRAILSLRLPDAVPVHEHVYVPRGCDPHVIEQARIEFTWPGQTIGPAAIVLEEMGWAPRAMSRLYGPNRIAFQCCMGDQAAFEAYVAARARDERAQREDAERPSPQGASPVGPQADAPEPTPTTPRALAEGGDA